MSLHRRPGLDMIRGKRAIKANRFSMTRQVKQLSRRELFV
jgi:hypothetical protein